MKQTDLIPNEEALRQAMQRRAERRKAECPPPANLEDIVMQRIMQQAASPDAAGRKRQRSRVYRLILPAVSAAAALLIGFLLWPDKEKPSAAKTDVAIQVAETAKDDALSSTTSANIDLQEQALIAQVTEQISRPTPSSAQRDARQFENPSREGGKPSGLHGTNEHREAPSLTGEREEGLLPSLMRMAGTGHVSLDGVDEPLKEKITGVTIVPTSADLGPGVTMRAGKPCPMTAAVEPLPEEQQPDIVIPADKQALVDIYLAETALQVAYQRQAQAEALRAYAASITGEELPQPIIAF